LVVECAYKTVHSMHAQRRLASGCFT